MRNLTLSPPISPPGVFALVSSSPQRASRRQRLRAGRQNLGNSYLAPAASDDSYLAPAAADVGYGAPSEAADASYGAPSEAADAGYGAPSEAADAGYGAPSEAADAGYGAPSEAADAGYGAPEEVAAAPSELDNSYLAPAASDDSYLAPAASDVEEALGSYGAEDELSGYEGLEEAASDAGVDMGLKMLMTSVPGVPGEDYPIYAEAPETAFSCEGQVQGGEPAVTNGLFMLLLVNISITFHNTTPIACNKY